MGIRMKKKFWTVAVLVGLLCGLILTGCGKEETTEGNVCQVYYISTLILFTCRYLLQYVTEPDTCEEASVLVIMAAVGYYVRKGKSLCLREIRI